MSPIIVTIVGVGPRGLTILDRLIEAQRYFARERDLAIHLVDPISAGQGVHLSDQPRALLTNTPASMITMFPHHAFRGGTARRRGPSLLEWAQEQGYRLIDGAPAVVPADQGKRLNEDTCLPRYILGDYLTWYYQGLLADLPRGITIFHHRSSATDVNYGDGRATEVYLNGTANIRTDLLFIATGHVTNVANEKQSELSSFTRDFRSLNPKLRFIYNPSYATLKDIDPDATVAVQGFGLTAHDVLSELTVGRGGSFVMDGRELKYFRSGLEPKILLFSRTGLPFSVRAVNQKPLGSTYNPHFFTPNAIRDLKKQIAKENICAQLDYDKHIFPLLVKEMAYIYSSTQTRSSVPPSRFRMNRITTSDIHSILNPLQVSKPTSFGVYRDFIRSHIEADLAEAAIGNIASPAKAAIEVIRDTRSTLRLAVEFGGLTPHSHRRFYERHHQNMNRLTFGPPIQRNRELLALFAAGVVDLAGGPGAKATFDQNAAKFVISSQFETGTHVAVADVLIEAKVMPQRLGEEASPFFPNLLKRGMLRRFKNGDYEPGGIDIDQGNRPIDRDGNVVRNVCIVGHPVEGAHYFTNALPLPLLTSRHVADADKCAERFLALSSPIRLASTFEL